MSVLQSKSYKRFNRDQRKISQIARDLQDGRLIEETPLFPQIERIGNEINELYLNERNDTYRFQTIAQDLDEEVHEREPFLFSGFHYSLISPQDIKRMMAKRFGETNPMATIPYAEQYFKGHCGTDYVSDRFYTYSIQDGNPMFAPLDIQGLNDTYHRIVKTIYRTKPSHLINPAFARANASIIMESTYNSLQTTLIALNAKLDKGSPVKYVQLYQVGMELADFASTLHGQSGPFPEITQRLDSLSGQLRSLFPRDIENILDKDEIPKGHHFSFVRDYQTKYYYYHGYVDNLTVNDLIEQFVPLVNGLLIPESLYGHSDEATL